MVYCHNCGTKNDDDSEFCSKCGEPLKDVRDYDRRRHHRDHHHRERDECFGSDKNGCFGLPHGNIIGPVIAGVVLILIGISSIYGFDIWNVFWPVLLVILGILILAGAIYSTRKR
jgi:uncharacterized membrane protein YvbJ